MPIQDGTETEWAATSRIRGLCAKTGREASRAEIWGISSWGTHCRACTDTLLVSVMVHGLETYATLVSINYHVGPVFNNTVRLFVQNVYSALYSESQFRSFLIMSAYYWLLIFHSYLLLILLLLWGFHTIMHWKSNWVGSKIVVFLSSLTWTMKVMTVSANKLLATQFTAP